MDVNPLIISLARTKWKTFVEIITQNEIRLDSEDWNNVYSLCNFCNSDPERVLSELRKIEYKYFEKYSNTPKLVNIPHRKSLSIKLDFIAKGST